MAILATFRYKLAHNRHTCRFNVFTWHCFILVFQTLYQKKAEGFEKELVIAKQQNKRFKAKVENLRNQLEQNVRTRMYSRSQKNGDVSVPFRSV